MEFERIQQLTNATRVMRAGSEQQRRRREQQNPQEFSEILEENLEEDDEEQEQARQQPSRTQDVVSLSSTGKVSAETMRAAGNLARISLAQRQLLELFSPDTVGANDEPLTSKPVPDSDPHFDELV